jgi:hypothetical protein
MTTQTDTRNPAAVALGGLGGKRKSPAQVAARQQNAQKARLAAEAKRAQIKHNAEIAALLTKGSQ